MPQYHACTLAPARTSAQRRRRPPLRTAGRTSWALSACSAGGAGDGAKQGSMMAAHSLMEWWQPSNPRFRCTKCAHTRSHNQTDPLAHWANTRNTGGPGLVHADAHTNPLTRQHTSMHTHCAPLTWMMSTAWARGCSLALKERMRRLSTDSRPLSFMSSWSSLPAVKCWLCSLILCRIVEKGGGGQHYLTAWTSSTPGITHLLQHSTPHTCSPTHLTHTHTYTCASIHIHSHTRANIHLHHLSTCAAACPQPCGRACCPHAPPAPAQPASRAAGSATRAADEHKRQGSRMRSRGVCREIQHGEQWAGPQLRGTTLLVEQAWAVGQQGMHEGRMPFLQQIPVRPASCAGGPAAHVAGEHKHQQVMHAG